MLCLIPRFLVARRFMCRMSPGYANSGGFAGGRSGTNALRFEDSICENSVKRPGDAAMSYQALEEGGPIGGMGGHGAVLT